jgi:hypothetical protein
VKSRIPAAVSISRFAYPVFAAALLRLADGTCSA